MVQPIISAKTHSAMNRNNGLSGGIRHARPNINKNSCHIVALLFLNRSYLGFLAIHFHYTIFLHIFQYFLFIVFFENFYWFYHIFKIKKKEPALNFPRGKKESVLNFFGVGERVRTSAPLT